MKTISLFLMFSFLFAFQSIKAQEMNGAKASKFTLLSYGGIGYGVVENENEPGYNLNGNTGEVLLNYKFGKHFGVGTGAGFTQLSGNGFNSLGNFYHERTLLKFPLLLTMDSKLSEKISLFANLGFYGQTILDDEYRYLNNTQKDVYEGWSFGTQFGLGFLFEISKNFGLGIHYLGQSDFSKFDSNQNSGIVDEQKLKSLNTIGLLVRLNL